MEKDVVPQVSTERSPPLAEADLEEENENTRRRETGILNPGADAITLTLKSGEYIF